jgi:ketosteroid isomerase-like protein
MNGNGNDNDGGNARAALEKLTIDFTEAFNREDIDEVMSYFADDGIYDEFNAVRHVGKAAIREAFIPQFRGDYGRMRFHTEDMFVEPGPEPGTGKALIRWLLTVEESGRAGGWRGLDILHFERGRLTEKHTYAKSRSPAVDKKAESERVRRAIDEGILLDI